MDLYPYFDAHCDTLSRCLQEGWDLWENPGHLDLRRLSACAPAGQVFSLFLDSARVPPPERFARISAQAELFRRARAAYPEAVERCRLSVEGAELMDCDERKLPLVRKWGVRWINLTWNHPNALAGSCVTGEGLTDRGRSFSRRCWELGMGVDVSHLSDQGFWDLMEIQDGPVLASHSCSRALWPHRRNLTDEMARAIFRAGGFVGVNYSTGFLGENPTAETVADHLERFLELGGEDRVGLGSDFDGTDVPPDLSGVQDLPNLWAALERRGWGERLIRKITYENLERFLTGLERAPSRADDMINTGGNDQ